MPEEQEHSTSPNQSSLPPNPQAITFKREEDFEALYANNVQAEHSIWDLKLIFGILDQSVVPNQVVQHTSINIPWTQVRLLSYWMDVGIAIQEYYNGKIKIPSGIMPPDPRTMPTPPEGTADLREEAGRLWDALQASL